MPNLPELVETQQARIWHDFALMPFCGTELEFYMPGAAQMGIMPTFWQVMQQACEQRGIKLFHTADETGADQYELSLAPTADCAALAEHTLTLKEMVSKLAEKFNLKADFSARPFPDQPGSGLHLHVSLHREDMTFAYTKQDENMSDALRHSIGGLLTWLPEIMPVCAPMPVSYGRFAEKSNAPLTISWGANNRTVAVRLPDSEATQKRIELRTAGADAEPHRLIAVALAAIHDGLTNKYEPGPQIFGDANLPQYGLPRLPKTPIEGMNGLMQSKRVPQYFNVLDLLQA